MKKNIISVLAAGFAVLLASLSMMYIAIFFFPSLMEEYYNYVFRSSSFSTDWLFYAHPFILSISLMWFWNRYEAALPNSTFRRSAEVALAYGIIAMLPVLWLTFSAIDISFIMVLTWLVYGIIQAFVAGIVFTKMKSK